MGIQIARVQKVRQETATKKAAAAANPSLLLPTVKITNYGRSPSLSVSILISANGSKFGK